MFVSFTRREYQLIKILLDILRHTFLNVRARYLVARKHFQISRQTKTPNPSSSSLSHSLKPQLHRIVCLRKTQSANDLKANPIVRNRGRNVWSKDYLAPISQAEDRMQHIRDAITDLHNPLHERTRGKPVYTFRQDRATRVHPAPRYPQRRLQHWFNLIPATVTSHLPFPRLLDLPASPGDVQSPIYRLLQTRAVIYSVPVNESASVKRFRALFKVCARCSSLPSPLLFAMLTERETRKPITNERVVPRYVAAVKVKSIVKFNGL